MPPVVVQAIARASCARTANQKIARQPSRLNASIPRVEQWILHHLTFAQATRSLAAGSGRALHLTGDPSSGMIWPKPTPGIETADFRLRAGFHFDVLSSPPQARIGRAVQVWIVNYHELSIGGLAVIQFHHVYSSLQSQAECRQRILGSEGREPPMTNDDRPYSFNSS